MIEEVREEIREEIREEVKELIKDMILHGNLKEKDQDFCYDDDYNYIGDVDIKLYEYKHSLNIITYQYVISVQSDRYYIDDETGKELCHVGHMYTIHEVSLPISKLSITEIPKKLTIQEKHEILGVITYLYWDIPFEPTSSEAKIPVKERKNDYKHIKEVG